MGTQRVCTIPFLLSPLHPTSPSFLVCSSSRRRNLSERVSSSTSPSPLFPLPWLYFSLFRCSLLTDHTSSPSLSPNNTLKTIDSLSSILPWFMPMSAISSGFAFFGTFAPHVLKPAQLFPQSDTGLLTAETCVQSTASPGLHTSHGAASRPTRLPGLPSRAVRVVRSLSTLTGPHASSTATLPSCSPCLTKARVTPVPSSSPLLSPPLPEFRVSQ